MAAIHTGIIPQNCGTCQRDPYFKETWGCDKPSSVVVETLIDDLNDPLEYFSCPIKFIPRSITSFYAKYRAIKGGQVQPLPYTLESNWYLDAVGYYEGWVDYYKARLKNG
jgi:hypothetical protein